MENECSLQGSSTLGDAESTVVQDICHTCLGHRLWLVPVSHDSDFQLISKLIPPSPLLSFKCPEKRHQPWGSLLSDTQESKPSLHRRQPPLSWGFTTLPRQDQAAPKPPEGRRTRPCSNSTWNGWSSWCRRVQNFNCALTVSSLYQRHGI